MEAPGEAARPRCMPFDASLQQALQVFRSLHALRETLEEAAGLCVEALDAGHKILACGNGGSACEAQHLVGELMGRYKTNRPSWAAIAIHADASVLTCLGNDYSFEESFSRQVEGLGREGDVLVVFSTSGQSPNILLALEAARAGRIASIAFLGRGGGEAAAKADCTLIVKHAETARIQEGHQFLLHALMDIVERERIDA